MHAKYVGVCLVHEVVCQNEVIALFARRANDPHIWLSKEKRRHSECVCVCEGGAKKNVRKGGGGNVGKTEGGKRNVGVRLVKKKDNVCER